jgi:hypothetical protein
LARHLGTVVPDVHHIEHSRGRKPRCLPFEINRLHETWLGEPEVLEVEAVRKTIGSDFPIIVTSYEMAMLDAKLLAHYKWKYLVFDEVIAKKIS